MKKIYLLAFVAMVAMGAYAQMNVWENGGLSAQYAIENVDSVTFGITSETPSSGTGKDGITPLLKIENDYWYVSYDEGQTWQQEGRAKGKDGQDGDSMFQSVTQDENYVYFTLADGTVIKIAKRNNNNQSNDEFIFTITYDPNGGIGTKVIDTIYYGYSTEIKACSFTKEGYSFVEWNTDKNGNGAPYQVGFTLSIDKNITLYAQWDETPITVHEYVDLGLSVKWATCNVGANTPEEYGDYFAWGETHPKSTYNWSTYKWCNGSHDTQTKYCTDSSYGSVDDKTVLEMSDDAARANWGGSWRMPSDTEIAELHEQCTWIWTTQNGVNGYKVKSKNNGNSIFLPAAGFCFDSFHSGKKSQGWYSSSSLHTDYQFDACYLQFTSDFVERTRVSRYYGQSVRPVCP